MFLSDLSKQRNPRIQILLRIEQYKTVGKPKLIQNQDDLNNLLNYLSAKDFPTHIRNQRPNTKWVLERIVNLQIRVFPTTYPLGNPSGHPDYIKNN